VELLEERRLLSGFGEGDLAPLYQPEQHSLWARDGYLSSPTSGNAVDVALGYLTSHAADLGITATDVRSSAVTDQYRSPELSLTHIYLCQQYDGLPIVNATLNINVTDDGRVFSVGSSFVATSAAQATDTGAALPVANGTAVVTAEKAMCTAATALGLHPEASLNPAAIGPVAEAEFASTTLSDAAVSLEPIPARAVYVATAEGLVRSWEMEFYTPDGTHLYQVQVDATSAELLGAADLAQRASYNVFALPTESPSDGARTIVTDPADPSASPYGWHDTNGVSGAEYTTTRGNNASVIAGGKYPSGGSSLAFDFPLDLSQSPGAYASAAAVNTFYWVNLAHDLHEHYGFTEAAGNFQQTNYSSEGQGGDAVQVVVQSADAANNAYCMPQPEGTSPMLAFGVWDYSTPSRDSDLDSIVILHEYGHAVSTRLVGGPSKIDTLNGAQSGGMGEGWSDWWGLMFTQKSSDTKTDAYPVGTYLRGQPSTGSGIRRYPYSFNMTVDPLTYGAYNTNREVHAVGEIWCSVLWDLNWLLIDKYGYSPSIMAGYTGSGSAGNILALQLVEDSLKLMPSKPTFLEGRDAILQADQALTGGANWIEIWTAFARRGMGVYAADGGSDSASSVTQNFDMPPPVISGTAPAMAGGFLDVGATALALRFSETVVGAGTATPYSLLRAGPDGMLGTADDVAVPLASSYSGTTATLSFPALSAGSYRLTVSSSITSLSGTHLDGNGDFQPGGSFVLDFLALPVESPPVTLYSPHGVPFDIGTDALTAGQLIQGSGNAFDGYGRLLVGGQTWQPGAAGATLADSGRSVVFAAGDVAGLSVSRKVTVPDSGSEDFARTLDTFVNHTAAPIATTVTVVGNLGANSATRLAGTSNGDGALQPADLWYLTDDGQDGEGGPALMHIVHGPQGLQPQNVSLSGDNLQWTFNVTIPAGQSLCLAYFTIAAPTQSAAVTAANMLVTSRWFGDQGDAFLSTSESAALVNFRFPPPMVTAMSGGTLALGATSVGIQFSKPVAGGAAANYQLQACGPDGLLGTSDDAIIPLTASCQRAETTLSFAPLEENLYRLTVRDTIVDGNGNRLCDAQGDVVDWTNDFAVVRHADEQTPLFGDLSTFALTGTAARSTATGDFNGDGKLDLAAGLETSSYQGLINILFGDGEGGFSSTTSFASGGSFMANIVAGDFNSDGRSELAVLHMSTGGLATFTANASGGFTRTAIAAGGRRVGSGDFNQDRRPDLVLTNFATNTVSVFLALGDGRFAAPIDSSVACPSDLEVGDFNNDAQLDVAVTSGNAGEIAILSGDGTGRLSLAATFNSGYNRQAGMLAADVNADGRLDLTVTGTGEGDALHCFLGNGNNDFSSTTVPTMGRSQGDPLAADVNQDDKVELLLTDHRSLQDGALLVLAEVGSSLQRHLDRFASGGDYVVSMATGDFDGDGRTDVVVINHDLTMACRLNTFVPAVLPSSVSLTLPNGLAVAVDVGTFGAGQLIGADGALDGDGRLSVGGVPYQPADGAYTLVDNGRSVVTAPAALGGLSVSREVTAPAAGPNLVRTIDTFTNRTSAPITTSVTISANLGSDEDTTVFATSSGDQICDSTDRWIGTYGGPGLAIVHYLHGSAGLRPARVAAVGDNLQWTYELTVPAGQSVCLAYFTIIAADRAAATASAAALATSAGFNDHARAFLTPAEVGTLANFVCSTLSAPTITGTTPSLAEGTLVAGVSSLVIDFGQAVAGADVAANYQLQGSGSDGLLGTADDLLMPVAACFQGTAATIGFPPLLEGQYRLTVRSAITNWSGAPLVGSGGWAEADWVADFVVISSSQMLTSTQSVLSGELAPWSMAQGDFNGDGHLDLAVANVGAYYNSSTGIVRILLGDGNGRLSAGVTITSGGTNARAITTGDFNGDGHPDLAVANLYSNNVALLLNCGDGTFASAQTFSCGGSRPYDVVAGDFDADGKLDLAVANYASNTVAILLGTGAGRLRAAVSYPVDAGPSALAIADLNGDGIPDLAVGNAGSQSVQILVNNGYAGFTVDATCSIDGFAPESIASGDFNRDGKPELALGGEVVTGQAGIRVLFSTSTGTWTEKAMILPVSSEVTDVVVGDFNGDGAPDLAGCCHLGSAVALYLGDGAGNFSLPALSRDGLNAPRCMAAGDFNRDGCLDLGVTEDAGSGESGLVRLMPGKGDGHFDPPDSFTYASGATAHMGYTSDGGASLAVGDFNRDGRLDVAVRNAQEIPGREGALGILLGDGAGRLQPATVFSSGGAAGGGLTTGDFNADGKLDLVAGNATGVSVVLGDGNGGFTVASTYPYYNGQVLSAGDFNRDGCLDVVTLSIMANKVVVLWGNGAGAFSGKSEFDAFPAGGGQLPWQMATGDFNADGLPDLAVSASSPGSAYQPGHTVGILLGNGNGFSAPTSFECGGSSPSDIAVGDFNGDGHLDLAVTNISTTPEMTVGILLGDGQGGFAPPQVVLSGLVNRSGFGREMPIAAGDVNGDGRLDLAVAWGNLVSVLLGDGAGGFSADSLYDTGDAYPADIAVGDFNADGRPDLALCHSCNVPVAILSDIYGPAPVTLTSPHGLAFDVAVNTAGAGQLVQGPHNAFDGDGRLLVDGKPYRPDRQTYTLDDGGQTVMIAQGTMAGLTIAREITVPSAGAQDFARTLDSFTNNTSVTIHATITVVGNLGADGATVVFATSNGLLDSSTEWIGIDDGVADGGVPAVIHYLHGPRGLRPASVQVTGDNISWTYEVTVRPGQTVCLAYLTIVADRRSDATSAAAALVNSDGLTAAATQLLTADEQQRLVNFRSNHAPLLDNSAAMMLAPVDENNTNSQGTLVWEMIASAGGDRITDPDPADPEGIAVVAVDNAHGTWQYRIGATGAWCDFGSVSASSARLLSTDTETWIRFVPALCWSGTVSGGITFRAWDQTLGSPGGTADTTATGGQSAFSEATACASIVVRSTNAEPSVSGLAVSPVSVSPGQDLILTATGVSDASPGCVVLATFYCESNGVAGLQTGSGGDLLVGSCVNPADSCAVTVATDGLARGRYTYYVQVTDNEGAVSTAISSTGVVRSNNNIDVDGNGSCDALTDGILVLRYLFNPSGEWTYADAMGVGATRSNRQSIKLYLDEAQFGALDVDGNGQSDALTDGILILRYLFQPEGAWSYLDALGTGATRTTREAIRAFLDQFRPSRAASQDLATGLSEPWVTPVEPSEIADVESAPVLLSAANTGVGPASEPALDGVPAPKATSGISIVVPDAPAARSSVQAAANAAGRDQPPGAAASTAIDWRCLGLVLAQWQRMKFESGATDLDVFARSESPENQASLLDCLLGEERLDWIFAGPG
jgi:hypothetical protein